MSYKLEFEKVQHIRSEYNYITNSISKVCEIIKRFSYRKQLPRIDSSSLWIFKHGIVYPYHGWTLLPKTDVEGARIMIPAWDGYDGEMFDNSSVLIPFDFINMTEEELVELFKETDNENI
jgi:hypothetical protein